MLRRIDSDTSLNDMRGESIDSNHAYPAHVWHLTSVRNLNSILRHGLVSHRLAHQTGSLRQDISIQDVQQKRSAMTVFGTPLHDFVPTFWAQRNPMMYSLKDIAEQLVWIQIDRREIDGSKCVTSNQNAVANGTSFYRGQVPEYLNWDVLRSAYWNDFINGSALRGAELLVQERITVAAIVGFQVATIPTWNIVSSITGQSPSKRLVRIEPTSFFL